MFFWKPPMASQFKMIDGSDHYRVKKSLVLRQFLCCKLRNFTLQNKAWINYYSYRLETTLLTRFEGFH